MEISSSSGKNSSFRNNPWELLESGEAVWADLDGHSREQVVRHYAPKIKILALRLKAKLPSSIELDELISSGSLGLLEALEHFDPGQNIRFNTYAESRIRGAMLDDLRKLDWFSRGMRQRVRLLEQAIQSLEQAGIEPSQDALQEETGLTPREVSEGLEALQNQVCLSLEMVQENFIPVGRDRSENQPFHAAAKQDLL
ncbi:MAG: sigma-70 family RNA polymerase sigma factor, partial [Desulfovibrionales bacterium]